MQDREYEKIIEQLRQERAKKITEAIGSTISLILLVVIAAWGLNALYPAITFGRYILGIAVSACLLRIMLLEVRDVFGIKKQD